MTECTTCGLPIPDDAPFCPKCATTASVASDADVSVRAVFAPTPPARAGKRLRRAAVWALVLGLLALISAIDVIAYYRGEPASARVTLEEYATIRPGLNLEQVAGVLREGTMTQVASSPNGEITRRWTYDDGSQVTVRFRNDVVVGVSQSGLGNAPADPITELQSRRLPTERLARAAVVAILIWTGLLVVAALYLGLSVAAPHILVAAVLNTVATPNYLVVFLLTFGSPAYPLVGLLCFAVAFAVTLWLTMWAIQCNVVEALLIYVCFLFVSAIVMSQVAP